MPGADILAGILAKADQDLGERSQCFPQHIDAVLPVVLRRIALLSAGGGAGWRLLSAPPSVFFAGFFFFFFLPAIPAPGWRGVHVVAEIFYQPVKSRGSGSS